MDVGFGGLSPPGLMGGIVEGRRKIWFLRNDYVDAFAKRIRICPFLVDGRGDERGVCFRVSLGHWIKLTVAPRFIGIVVAFRFISRSFIVHLSTERAPGTDPGRWLEVGIDIRPESFYGGGGISGARPPEHERGAAAGSTGCSAIGNRVVLYGRGSTGVLGFP